MAGLRELPWRVAFNGVDFGRVSWWGVFAVAPAALLTFGALAGDRAPFVYSMYCAVILTAVLQSSERFIGMSVALDDDAGELESTYHMGDPSLFRSDEDVTTSLADVETARFVTIGDRTVVRLYYEQSFVNKPSMFLVPDEFEPRFRETLRQYNVSIRVDSTLKSADRVWGRFAVTALFLGAIPLGTVFVWPAGSVPFLLAVFGHAAFVLRQGW
ncbi:hypothetical protein C5B91_16120 [Haloferax sp. Atlit-10N]|uniref:Uncharacterized protein n=1 Tax=Haloferax prahovense (strain DSM 18310 / JCM 13924 / TL6) TaxID=1227461 RepID=M0GAJ9_HALPT|nr:MULTISPECIES: hypothetical protein [Haloferax]ELZ69250.1 hypothetical protein C457_08964 [Haloferax prahovense DSM 18310]RDZ42347.1 hypothetical protein C5B86_16690 [Haloferax sp. Atlit-19N]RDZ42633.1 hypothetical protein C5B87_16950 [Haloferax sp. Atlit-16N]RDZ57505.1 hypothetical protein C5B91_16120 [Haloferax sp. Atlit-10N]REA01702.1 hypothetical protein DEQ92_16150 [Haloferax sp. Atlit-6N]